MADLPKNTRAGCAIRQGKRWLLALTVGVVGTVAGGAVALRHFGAGGAWLTFWPQTGPSIVSYESNSAGGRLTLRTEAAGVRAAVAPNGRELRLDITGATINRRQGGKVGDGLVQSYELLPEAETGFAVLIYLIGYGGHELTESDGVITCDIIRSPLMGRKIVIDPGHGGRDPGCVSVSGLREAALTLPVAEELKRLLETAGAAVRLTRDADTDFSRFFRHTMDSYDRVAVANDWQAEVFVSIHFNAFTSPRYGGTEVWHYGDKPESLRLTRLIMDELAGLGLSQRGVKKGDFAVLREANMPAVLVELGFLSNPDDEKVFLDPANQAKAAELMWQALLAFFG